MGIDNQLLLILSAFGALNGILISFYFFTLKPFKVSNQFLSALILVISIRILKSVLFYFNPEITRVILQIGLSACFFIGPFLYFYCASKRREITEQTLRWKLHFGSLFVLALGVGLIYPYQTNSELWGTVFYKVINYVWLFYIILSGTVLIPTFNKFIKAELSIEYDDIWLLSIYIGNVIIWVTYFTASYTSYIVGALSFSFIFYLMCLLVIINHRSKKDNVTTKYANKKIEKSQANSLNHKLEQLMTQEQLFKNANLTMPNVAKSLAVSTPLLSQLLNDNLNKSFSLFINEYRIAEAEKLLMCNKKMKMDVIAETCGFNSQSTFYSAFKKVTGTTPAKFAKRDNQLS